jgi:hypothetical protein
MNKASEITKLIHDNFWTVLSFAFGQPAIRKVINEKYAGEWKYLHKSVFQNAEIRADRALLELATQLRVLDDADGLNGIIQQEDRAPFGIVVQADGSQTEMHFQDLTKKIIQGRQFEWRLCDPTHPKIIVVSNEPERWRHAEISIVALMRLIGGLMGIFGETE